MMDWLKYQLLAFGIKIFGKFFGYCSVYAPDDTVKAIHFAYDEDSFNKSIRDIATAETILQTKEE